MNEQVYFTARVILDMFSLRKPVTVILNCNRHESKLTTAAVHCDNRKYQVFTDTFDT